MNPKVDAFINKTAKWPRELEKLRKILLASGLTEELKWGHPCYSYDKHNVVIIGELKDSCVFSFFKGALLKDKKNILEKPGENTQSARVIKFKSLGEITKMESTLKAY